MDEKEMMERLQRLADRMQQLEQRNADLERQVKALAATPAGTDPSGPAATARLEKLESQNQALQQRVDSLAKVPEAAAEDDEGPKFTASLLTVGQRVNARGSGTGGSQGRINYRGDVTATLSAGSIGEAKGSLFAQLRVGQGTGIGLVPTHSSTANSSGFQTAAGADDSFGVLAQAYYQLEWPIGGSGFNGLAGDRVILNVGKMDFFSLFDQNEVAGDEASKFLNNAFVHNPLLDSGGDIAADAYGFAPGVRLGYFSRSDDTFAWGASVGVFGSGRGANFSGNMKQPLVVAQFEIAPKLISGDSRGNYRIYAWTNGGTADFAGNPERHSGLGISLDQKFGRDWNVFARWGRRTSGDGTFNNALTGGFEYGGKNWGRAKDAVGIAVGLLQTSSAWRAATLGSALVGYEASGAERIAEIYYRIKVNDHLEVSPDFQLIQRPGGNGLAPSARVFGLRANLAF